MRNPSAGIDGAGAYRVLVVASHRVDVDGGRGQREDQALGRLALDAVGRVDLDARGGGGCFRRGRRGDDPRRAGAVGVHDGVEEEVGVGCVEALRSRWSRATWDGRRGGRLGVTCMWKSLMEAARSPMICVRISPQAL